MKANYHLHCQPISDLTCITAGRETSWTKIAYIIASIFFNSAERHIEVHVWCILWTDDIAEFVFPHIWFGDTVYAVFFKFFKCPYWMPEGLLTSLWNASLHLNWFVGTACCWLEYLRCCQGDILYLYHTRVSYISLKCVSARWQHMTCWNLIFIKNEAWTSINNEGFK